LSGGIWAGMVIWLKECEICDAGLCVRMDALKSEGRTQREAARIMEGQLPTAKALGLLA